MDPTGGLVLNENAMASVVATPLALAVTVVPHDPAVIKAVVIGAVPLAMVLEIVPLP